MQAQFDRETWRPGRKRGPRKRHWGGQTKAPAGFIAAGVAGRFGSGIHRQCAATSRRTGVRCRAVAMIDAPCCAAHGGHGLQAITRRKREREKTKP
jgi:hypothetical protein